MTGKPNVSTEALVLDCDGPIALESCVQEAGGFLEDAQRELRDFDPPAVYYLVQACTWLHAALEIVARQQQQRERP